MPARVHSKGFFNCTHLLQQYFVKEATELMLARSWLLTLLLAFTPLPLNSLSQAWC